MTKRNIAIVGIMLILIAITIISIDRSQSRRPSTEVPEPVALNVGDVVVDQVSLTHSMQYELTGGVDTSVNALEVNARVGTSEVVASVNTLDAVASVDMLDADASLDTRESSRMVKAVAHCVGRGEQGVESAVGLRDLSSRVDGVQVDFA